MKRKVARTRRPLLLFALVALVAGLAAIPAPALGAAPAIFHANFSETEEDVEVCGIIVDFTTEGQFTTREFLDEEGNFVLFHGTASFTETFTAANGKSVIARDANLLTISDPLIDEEAGTITFVNTLRGVLEQMKTPDGPVLLLPAGLATFAITFDLDTDEFISFELLRANGLHPEGDIGTLFCEVLTDALA